MSELTAVYSGKYEEATTSLINVLHRVSKEGLHESSLEEGEKIMSVLSSAVTALFSSPNFFLNETGFRSLIALKMSLRRVFLASSFRDMSHIFANLSVISDGKAQINPANYAKLLLVVSLDSIQVSVFPIIENLREDAQLLIWTSLLDTRYVVTESDQKNLDRLIAMADKIQVSPFKSDLEILCATRAWFFCSYWDNPDKHEVKKILNKSFYKTAEFTGKLPPVRDQLKIAEGTKPKILMILEIWTSYSAMYRCYAAAYIKLAQEFELVALVPSNQIDENAKKMFSKVIYMSETGVLSENIKLVSKVAPDIILYSSIGMNSQVICLAQLRLAPIQLMNTGHPASSFSEMIDYMILPEEFLPSNLDEITEKIILVESNTFVNQTGIC